MVEYSSNIKAEAHIPELLHKATQTLIDQGGVFPIGGIRARAIELTEYYVADGEEDYAFVHTNLKIAVGRDEATKKKVCDELFEMLKTHFAELFSNRYLALSLELTELNDKPEYRYNNIHARFKKS